ncbi:MAG TPA: PTS sugar transporter subunit IIB [bacterium]|nr:PTS sugar transporter subunit IIB [bacterium]
MGVLLYRVDDRLIHGQVVVGWGRYLKINSILVCSDRVADDELARTMMEMGAPADVKVEVLRPREAAAKLNGDAFAERSAIVLFETPADALRLLDMNVKIEKLNVGGMHFGPGKRQIMEGLSVDEEDCRALCELAARNVRVYFQMVPQARPVEVISKLPRDL